MERWIIDKSFYSEEEVEGMLGEYLDICLALASQNNEMEAFEILEAVEFGEEV